jgi:hypothetical protein
MQRWADMVDGEILARTTEKIDSENDTPIANIQEQFDEYMAKDEDDIRAPTEVAQCVHETNENIPVGQCIHETNENIPVGQCVQDVLKVALQQGPPPIDFLLGHASLDSQTVVQPHTALLKKELHHILNSFQAKDKNANSICIYDNLKDPRFNKIGDYMFSLKGKAVYIPELRRSIGKPNDIISQECKQKFRLLRQNLTNIIHRIDNVLD